MQAICRVNACHGGIISRNFSQRTAIICGFAHAKGQWAATLDEDLEHATEILPGLYRKTLEENDLVYCIDPERNHKAWRNITSNAARWLFNKAIPSLSYINTSFFHFSLHEM